MAINQVTVIGEIVTELRYSHTIFGERFYEVELLSKRLSDTVDVLPVMISERQLCVGEDYRCERVSITGELRSYHCREGRKRHLQLHVFAKEIVFLERESSEIHTNEIYLEGEICKEPFFRVTPRGKEILEMTLVVRRGNGHEDYIPCICWGRNARYMQNAKVGECVKILGRIQSREYIKRDAMNKKIFHITYEVSVNQVW